MPFLSKHTPGPWVLREELREPQVVVFSLRGGLRTVATWLRSGFRAREADRANARLMAAAPELLAIAKRVLARHSRGFVLMGEDVDELEAVIAAAEGK